ncbi:MAG: hypothetical protein ACXWYM_00420 [Candidatus Binatia bacterium]
MAEKRPDQTKNKFDSKNSRLRRTKTMTRKTEAHPLRISRDWFMVRGFVPTIVYEKLAKIALNGGGYSGLPEPFPEIVTRAMAEYAARFDDEGHKIDRF